MNTNTKLILALVGVGAAAAVGAVVIARQPDSQLKAKLVEASTAVKEWADPILTEALNAQSEARTRLTAEFAALDTQVQGVKKQATEQLHNLQEKLPSALQS